MYRYFTILAEGYKFLEEANGVPVTADLIYNLDETGYVHLWTHQKQLNVFDACYANTCSCIFWQRLENNCAFSFQF